MPATSPSPTSLADVTPAEWQRLAARRLFFGHQSVGGNILDGVVKVLAEHPDIGLRVVEASDPARMTAPALYHARIGKNGAPQTKLESFRQIAGAMGEGAAMVKYCYVDVDAGTDPAKLFGAYRDGIAALKAANPSLTVVHLTLPLQADWGHFHHYWRVLRNQLTTYRELNSLRHAFNEQVRQTYGGRDPIFDLAQLQSVGADGREQAVRWQWRRVPVLARDWTEDGGHLNEAGRRRVGEAFLAFLAKL